MFVAVGFPARRKEPHANPERLAIRKPQNNSCPFRAAGMPPSTSGRDA